MREIKPTLILKGEVTSEPVSLQELKNQLRITHEDEDTYLLFLISAAREALEQATQRMFAQREVTVTFSEYGCAYRLPCPPFVGPALIQGQAFVTSRDDSGASLSAGVIGNMSLPFEVTYEAGGITSLSKMCILLWAAHLYEARQPVGEKVSEMPMSLGNFVSMLRVVNVY
jgi:hypothetical protein